MRMKEVCEKTGLTDRAVRLYIENGLLSPTRESSASGRKTILFSDEDVEILRTIAILRQADFSLADIRDMLSDAQRIPGILADHREKLAEEIADRQRILQTLENIGPEEAADCAAASLALRIPETVSWSVRAKTVTPTACARETNSSGEQVPSEWLECTCRSIIKISFANTLISV